MRFGFTNTTSWLHRQQTGNGVHTTREWNTRCLWIWCTQQRDWADSPLRTQLVLNGTGNKCSTYVFLQHRRTENSSYKCCYCKWPCVVWVTTDNQRKVYLPIKNAAGEQNCAPARSCWCRNFKQATTEGLGTVLSWGPSRAGFPFLTLPALTRTSSMIFVVYLTKRSQLRQLHSERWWITMRKEAGRTCFKAPALNLSGGTPTETAGQNYRSSNRNLNRTWSRSSDRSTTILSSTLLK